MARKLSARKLQAAVAPLSHAEMMEKLRLAMYSLPPAERERLARCAHVRPQEFADKFNTRVANKELTDELLLQVVRQIGVEMTRAGSA